MFRNLLKPDSPLMITMTQITDCIFLSLFWLIGCIPVVTVGTSFAALYDATYRGFRKGEKHCWQRFGKVFKDNWKAGIVPTIIFLVLSGVLVRLLVLAWNAAVYEQISWMLFSAAAFLGILAVGILSILFPMLSRFENSTGVLLKNTVLLGIAHAPRTLGLGLLNALTVLLCVRFVVPVCFLPSLSALLGSLFIEPIFKPYIEEEDVAA